MDSKPWYASRTMWGAVLSIVSGFVPLAGTVLSVPEVNDTAVDALASVGALVGGAVAAWGRTAATTTITSGGR